jgi:hypothetical protein
LEVAMLERTYTCSRCLELLESFGVSGPVMSELVDKAEAVAAMRGSDRLGFKHLVIARGLGWGALGASEQGTSPGGRVDA